MACLCTALFAAGPAVPEISAAPPLDPGAIALEFAGAVVGGAICAAGLSYGFRPPAESTGGEWRAFGGTVVSGSIGYPLFCGLGAWGAGAFAGEHGRLVPALVGAFASAPFAVSLAWLGALLERSPRVTIKSSPIYVVAALLPAAGAVYGYNRSITRSVSGRARSRVAPPAFGLRLEGGPDGHRSAAVDARLLRLSF